MVMVANRRRIPFRYAIRHHVKVLCGAVAVMNSMVVGNGERMQARVLPFRGEGGRRGHWELTTRFAKA